MPVGPARLVPLLPQRLLAITRLRGFQATVQLPMSLSRHGVVASHLATTEASAAHDVVVH